MILARKIIKIPEFLRHLPEKNYNFPEFYMIFARKICIKIRKMPKFYMILARKIIKIPEFLRHLPEKNTIFPNFT